MADLNARFSDEASNSDSTSSSNDESLPRPQQQLPTLGNTNVINDISARSTANPHQNLMTSQRATHTVVTSQGSLTSYTTSQGDDAMRMLDGT